MIDINQACSIQLFDTIIVFDAYLGDKYNARVHKIAPYYDKDRNIIDIDFDVLVNDIGMLSVNYTNIIEILIQK
jgi:hypothetical protein